MSLILRGCRTSFRSVFSALERYRLANEVESTYGLPSIEDLEKLKAESKRILTDPICDVSEGEARSFLLPAEPESGSLYERARWAISGRSEATNRLFRLTIERLENRRLQAALGIGHGFNQQLFWMMLHAWVLHKRMVVYEDGAQEEDYFEALFKVIDHWLLLKEIPRHRLTLEIANAQRHALGFCVGLDVAIEKPEILGVRVKETLKGAFFDQNPKNMEISQIDRLTKYLIRQASFALHIPRENFLQGQFVWIDFPIQPETVRKIYKN